MDVVFKTDTAVFNLRVAGIYIENGHVLIHKMLGDTTWSLPGGRVEIAEETKNSLKREFLEELGIEIEVTTLVFTVENFFNYNGKDIHEIGFYYFVNSNDEKYLNMSGTFYGVEGERLIYKWVPINHLDEIELYPIFLRRELKDLPESTKHIIVRQ
jgi:8-oxo-dGTP pyrophosphatase MutT (NUDIX family)